MNPKLRLFALSFLMLFVELAIIRWAGSNVVYLSYFSNFVLLGSFLGIGIGFLRADRERPLFPWAPLSLAALVVFVSIFPVQIDRSGAAVIYFGDFSPSGLPPWVMLPLVFLAAAVVLATIADGVARTFALFKPLDAYRLDIMGSIVGIAAFSVLSFSAAPPIAWGGIASLIFVLTVEVPNKRRFFVVWAPTIALLGALAIETATPYLYWSPYYKVRLEPEEAEGYVGGLSVNGIPHQAITSIDYRRATEPVYFLPYERFDLPLDPRVLVIGAGNGGDVAIALEQGARRVDAVEIDPQIQELGDELHPQQPYSDPRVHVYIDDGRAFIERSDALYDLIIFALPDSLTLVSGQSSLRLESFLFTEEGLEAARERLAPGGAFAMYNFYREPWLIDRLAGTLEAVYDRPPCLDTVGDFGGLALMMASSDPETLSCEVTWSPLTAAPPEPVHDDYPFLYLRDRNLPPLYLAALGLVLAAAVVAVRVFGGRFREMTPYLDLFFMGVAFLLLETKNVVQFALLFGTTWFVNALVFAGVLLAVLAAIEVAQRVRFRRPQRLYALLLAALVLAFAVPQDALLQLNLPLRFAAAVSLAFLPIFLANLVFAERFRDVGSSTTAFGANLLGAMVGGVLEYGSLLTGYRALLVLVALLYGAAFLAGRGHLTGAAR